MHLLFPLFIAIRFLRSKSNNGYLSFIAWASMIGLILGVMSLVVVTSVLNGFESTLTTKILGMVPHASVNSKQPIKDWQAIANNIKQSDDNVIDVAPFVRTRGMTSINGNVHGTIINGILPEYQAKISILNDSVIHGNIYELTSGGKNIALGKTIVDKNNLTIGDEISIFLSKPSNSSIGMDIEIVTFSLVAVFDVSEEINNWMSYVAMDDASELMKIERGATGFRLKLDDVMSPENSLEQAGQVSGIRDYYLTNWKMTHGGIHETLQMQKTITSLLLFLIVLVAAFNIVSTLVMMVTDKKSDIAILKTVGFTPRMISQVFFNQGVVVGLFGTAIGLTLGIVITLLLEKTSFWLDTTFNFGLFEHYYVDALPTQIHWLDILVIAVSSMLISVIAAAYPAMKASKIEPATALRYE